MPGATQYVAVDAELTRETPEPAPPVPLCVASDGHPVLCDWQVALWIVALRGATDTCNADKAAIVELGAEDVRRD